MARYRGTLLALALLSAISPSSCGFTAPEPTQGTLDAPCYPNDTCNTGLECKKGTCLSVGQSGGAGAAASAKAGATSAAEGGAGGAGDAGDVGAGSGGTLNALSCSNVFEDPGVKLCVLHTVQGAPLVPSYCPDPDAAAGAGGEAPTVDANGSKMCGCKGSASFFYSSTGGLSVNGNVACASDAYCADAFGEGFQCRHDAQVTDSRPACSCCLADGGTYVYHEVTVNGPQTNASALPCCGTFHYDVLGNAICGDGESHPPNNQAGSGNGSAGAANEHCKLAAHPGGLCKSDRVSCMVGSDSQCCSGKCGQLSYAGPDNYCCRKAGATCEVSFDYTGPGGTYATCCEGLECGADCKCH